MKCGDEQQSFSVHGGIVNIEDNQLSITKAIPCYTISSIKEKYRRVTRDSEIRAIQVVEHVQDSARYNSHSTRDKRI